MKAKVKRMASAAAIAFCCASFVHGHAQAYYLDLSGTVTGNDAGSMLLGKPSLSAPVPVSLILYTNPTPIVELIVGPETAVSYTFFMNQPASVALDQTDPQKLSLSVKFGDAGYHSADKNFYRSVDGSITSGNDQAAILAGTAQTSYFRKQDVVDDGTADGVTLDPFHMVFSAISLNTQQRSDFVIDVTRIRFADVGFVGPSVVPLPASAPLFGMALLAFGAAGWSMKRRGTART